MTYFTRLRDRVLIESNDADWDKAKFEWKLVSIYKDSEPHECLCTHEPIIEICVIRNTKNGNELEIGNRCVNHFLGLNAGKHFACLRRIIKDNKKSSNPELLYLAFERGIITKEEYNYYISFWRLKIIDEEKQFFKQKVNIKIIESFKK